MICVGIWETFSGSQALKIDLEIGDRRNEGAWLGNLGLAYSALGDAKKAIEYYEQALKIAREIGDRRNEGIWLGNLGLAYYPLSADVCKFSQFLLISFLSISYLIISILSLIHISEPTRRTPISYAVFCLKK